MRLDGHIARLVGDSEAARLAEDSEAEADKGIPMDETALQSA